MNTGGIQDVGTIGSWTPSRLTRYIQNEMNLRQRDAKTSLSADELFAHNNLTFSSGDFQTADTKVTRPGTGILAINNVPILTSTLLKIDSSGVHSWSANGTSAPDTNLYRAGASLLKTDSWFISGGPITSAGGNAGPGQGAVIQGGNTYIASNNWMTGMVAGNLYFDGTNWQNKNYGGNNGWGLVGFEGAASAIDFYLDTASGAVDRVYTPAQLQAKLVASIKADGLYVGTTRQPKMTASAISGGPPGSPTDGDIWLATGVDANGTVWHFRYNAGSASALKWEFIGGPPMVVSAEGSSSSQTTINVWQFLTNAPSITIPRNGDYIVQGMSSLTNGASVGAHFLGIDSTSTLNPGSSIGLNSTVANTDLGLEIGPSLKTGLVAANLVRLLHFTSVQPITWGSRTRMLSLLPVRIS